MPDEVIDSGVNKRRGARTALRLDVATRRATALELRVAGASFSEIATALNYKPMRDGSPARGHVAQDISRAIRAVTAAPAEELRDLELARLDQLQRAHWTAAKTAGPEGVKAANLVVKIIERRCKLLGIDAPTKVDLNAWLRDFAEREGLPYDFAVSAANDVLKNAGF